MSKDENKEMTALQALDTAQKLEAMHMMVKKQFPTDYIKRMQPYVNAIIHYKKKNKTKNNLEAALAMASESPKLSVMLLATAVEMTSNEK